MTEWYLDAVSRDVLGKSGVRKLRRTGQVPAIIYGLKDPQPIQVPEREAALLVHRAQGVSRMVTLRLADTPKAKPKERRVLLKEVQTTPVGNKLLHIDFNEIDIKQTVHATVEMRPLGMAAGVKFGGTMQTVLHELTVECLPTEIPEFLEADVSHLEIGQALHVADLVFPPGVKPVTDQHAAVIVISGQMREEVEEEEIAEAELEVEDVTAAEEPEEPSPADS